MTAAKTRGKRNIRGAINPDPDTVVKSAPATQLSKQVKHTKKKAVGKGGAAAATLTTVTDAAAIPDGFIRIEVFAGPSGHSHHAGLARLVEPLPPKASQNTHCKIGRSSAEDFAKYGVSLWKDNEVSTKHGVIHRIKNDFYYKDVGSSNGTFGVATNIRLENLVPFKLENGTELLLGQHILKFNFSS
jgi:hypothetical protein